MDPSLLSRPWDSPLDIVVTRAYLDLQILTVVLKHSLVVVQLDPSHGDLAYLLLVAWHSYHYLGLAVLQLRVNLA